MTRADETEVVETVTAALFDAVNDFDHDEACRRGTVISHCAAVHVACLATGSSQVQSSTPGPGGLSVHAGQLSAYSEIKHRVFNGVLFNLGFSLVAWHSGRKSIFDWQTFVVLHSTYS